MCVDFLVLFVLLCYQVLSGTPQIGNFWPTPPGVEVPPRTWQDADTEIATRPFGYVEVAGGSVVPRGRWDKAWWYASPEHDANVAQWEQAQELLHAEFIKARKASRAAGTPVVTPHIFIGIKLRIDSFAYAKSKKEYEETHAGETYPPPDELPAGITLLWSNGQAPTKTIALDDDSLQTTILTQALYREDTNEAVRRALIKKSDYDKRLEALKGGFIMHRERAEVQHHRQMKKCQEKPSRKMVARCLQERQKVFDQWEAQMRGHEKQAIAALNPTHPTLGLVMFMEHESGTTWRGSNKFVPIDEPFEPKGLSFFFVQELEKTERAETKSRLRPQIDPETGERVESVKVSRGELSPLQKRSGTGPAELSAAGSSHSSRGKKKEKKTAVPHRVRRGTVVRESAERPEVSRTSAEVAHVPLPGTRPVPPAMHRSRRGTAASRSSVRPKVSSSSGSEFVFKAAEEPSPERYPPYYAHNDEYGHVYNTKESKSPTMIILMITMCIMTVVCCGCAIIAAECYCIGKAHGSKNKETMEEEDAILRLEHIQNCI